jgi:hypothetical protein
LNPELKKPRKKYDATPSVKKKKIEKQAKQEKEDTTITPFKLFLKEQKEKNPDFKYRDAQIQYQNLGDQEKLSYINKVLCLETDRDKIFTSDEKKIMKHSSGMPVRPLSAYNTFVQSNVKNQKLGKGQSSIRMISEMWKNTSAEEKKHYERKFQEDLEKWKSEMQAWINTLPFDQRAEQIAKHKLFAKSNNTKRKRELSVSSSVDEYNEDMSFKIEQDMPGCIVEIADVESRQKSPKKKKVNSDSEGAASPSKKNQTAIDWDHVFDTNKTSSPKKESIEKQLSALGEYPSQTTAHYFMVKLGGGKAQKKLAKAYKELSKAEKKKLFREMTQAKNSYLNKIKDFAKKLDPKHSSKVLDFHKQNKEDQGKSLSWHVASGTDNEESSSDESDDDDDSNDS